MNKTLLTVAVSMTALLASARGFSTDEPPKTPLTWLQSTNIDYEATRKAYDVLLQRAVVIGPGLIIPAPAELKATNGAVFATNIITITRGVDIINFCHIEESSAVVTNVVVGSNEKGCSYCDAIAKNNWLVHHPSHGGLPYVPATERWEIIQTIRRTTVIFKWRKEVVHVEDEPLSSTTNRWRLEQEWKAKE